MKRVIKPYSCIMSVWMSWKSTKSRFRKNSTSIAKQDKTIQTNQDQSIGLEFAHQLKSYEVEIVSGNVFSMSRNALLTV